jgi:hypothetical protein
MVVLCFAFVVVSFDSQHRFEFRYFFFFFALYHVNNISFGGSEESYRMMDSSWELIPVSDTGNQTTLVKDEAYIINQGIGSGVLFIYDILIIITIHRERYRIPLPILTFVAHRMIAVVTLLQMVRHIDPNGIHGIFPRVVCDLLQANSVVAILILVSFFVYQTVNGAYRTYSLPFPRLYRWLTLVVSIGAIFAFNIGVILSTVLNEEKWVAVNYLMVAISTTVFVPAFVFAVLRLVTAVDATSLETRRASIGAQQFASRAVRRLRCQMLFFVSIYPYLTVP